VQHKIEIIRKMKFNYENKKFVLQSTNEPDIIQIHNTENKKDYEIKNIPPTVLSTISCCCFSLPVTTDKHDMNQNCGYFGYMYADPRVDPDSKLNEHFPLWPCIKWTHFDNQIFYIYCPIRSKIIELPILSGNTRRESMGDIKHKNNVRLKHVLIAIEKRFVEYISR
jgi:hypothetical protein